MLLENNTKKVINLIHQFDNLSDIDKVRLAIYLLEHKNLTANQLEAIDIICNTPDIAIIQGPPGTGKTTIISEAVTQINPQRRYRVPRLPCRSYKGCG